MNYLKFLRRSCKSFICLKYNIYLSYLVDNIQDNLKKFWSFYSVKIKIRKLFLVIKNDVNSNFFVIDLLEKVNLFNDYFNSVFSKFNNEFVLFGYYFVVLFLGQLIQVVILVRENKGILKNLDLFKCFGFDDLIL